MMQLGYDTVLNRQGLELVIASDIFENSFVYSPRISSLIEVG